MLDLEKVKSERVGMKINNISSSISATPIRPLFKGNINSDNRSLFKACEDYKFINNKNLEVDKFEKR